MSKNDQKLVRRPLTQPERQLVEFLLHLAEGAGVHDLDATLIKEMDDGGMGSLQFGESRQDQLGHMVAEARFADDDGLPVFASLVLDQLGQWYELDLWKVDLSPLKRIPDPSNFQSAD